MDNQGLYGALLQYWGIEPKMRLSRRNSYLDDHTVSNGCAVFLFCLFFSIATAIVVLWSLMGVLL